MVIPPMKDFDDAVAGDYPSQIQHLLDSAIQRQRHQMDAQVADFTAKKKQEFKSWRAQAREHARAIAKLAVPSKRSPQTSPKSGVTINTPKQATRSSGSELFEKSPVVSYSHPGASPLAAASSTRSVPDRPATPSPPPVKVVPPPIPLSSSLKSPGSSNFAKPIKRVMFQDPPEDEIPSDVDYTAHDTSQPIIPSTESAISVDGMLNKALLMQMNYSTLTRRSRIYLSMRCRRHHLNRPPLFNQCEVPSSHPH
jgi:hypothetical protein